MRITITVMINVERLRSSHVGQVILRTSARTSRMNPRVRPVKARIGWRHSTSAATVTTTADALTISGRFTAYFVSLCGLCFPQRGQNLRVSIRSGCVRLFFVVW